MCDKAKDFMPGVVEFKPCQCRKCQEKRSEQNFNEWEKMFTAIYNDWKEQHENESDNTADGHIITVLS